MYCYINKYTVDNLLYNIKCDVINCDIVTFIQDPAYCFFLSYNSLRNVIFVIYSPSFPPYNIFVHPLNLNIWWWWFNIFNHYFKAYASNI